jgi:ribosome recycling factor
VIDELLETPVSAWARPSTRRAGSSAPSAAGAPARPARPHQCRLLRNPTPLKQLATISAPEPRLLSVQPYDKSSIKAIEKAILESDVGLTPNNDGNLIRLAIPELTEERRKEQVKVVRNIAEEGRVAIRNIRRDCMHDLRELRESGETGSDEEHRAENELQKVTDAQIGELDGLLKAKEAEILEV